MPEDFLVEKREDHIYAAIYAQQNTYRLSRRLFTRVVALCEAHDCYDVLVESFATKPMTASDAFNHTKIFEEVGITLDYRIAWVAHVRGVARQARTAEMVLKKRGLLNGRVFNSLDEAKLWLLNEGPVVHCSSACLD